MTVDYSIVMSLHLNGRGLAVVRSLKRAIRWYKIGRLRIVKLRVLILRWHSPLGMVGIHHDRLWREQHELSGSADGLEGRLTWLWDDVDVGYDVGYTDGPGATVLKLGS
jgi:hypothetical protein